MRESLGTAIARVLADAIAADQDTIGSGQVWNSSLALDYIMGKPVLPPMAPPPDPERCSGCGTPCLPVLIPGDKWVIPNPCEHCVGVGSYVNAARGDREQSRSDRLGEHMRRAGLTDERYARAHHTLDRHGPPGRTRTERTDGFTYIESSQSTAYLVHATRASIEDALDRDEKRSVMALRTDWWLADTQASWDDARIKAPQSSQLYKLDHVLLELREPLGGWKPWSEAAVLGLIQSRHASMKMTTLITKTKLDDWVSQGSKLGAALYHLVPNEGGF